MKFKLLLSILLFAGGILYAQDTLKQIVISEARMDRGDKTYIEITNMGDTAVNLNLIELGVIRPWSENWYTPEDGRRFMLPDHLLGPGESYVIASIKDWGPEQYKIEVAKFGYSPNYSETSTYPEMEELADLQIHSPEDPLRLDPTDSVSVDPVWGDLIHFIFSDVWARECWILRHHISETDSAVIDQVGGVFDENGLNGSHPYDVAGVTDATANSVLVRKFLVKEGNIDFANGRGTDISDSEWLPIPLLDIGASSGFRVPFWTVGNHGNYVIDENTFVPKNANVSINLTDSILTLPWGSRNNDSVMYQFERKPGLAWKYDYAENHEDSAYISVRTGDKLTVWAVGNTLTQIELDIEVTPPPTDANIVIPKRELNDDGFYYFPSNWDIESYQPFNVTDGLEMDTIYKVLFATRVDTLLKYLEKAPNASWELVWVDGVERTDLKNGDILRVTAEDGTSVKDYFIKVSPYRESLNPYLSAITWPDIPDPEYYETVYGWKGDTIPAFVYGKTNYKINLPFDITGVPALVAKTQDLNTTVVTERAKNLTGSLADRTTYFHTTADDDSTELTYEVVMAKEKNPRDIQPWPGAEPFFSEIVFWDQWSNGYVEVVNPGTEPLDLSNYMFASAGDVLAAIERPWGPEDWAGQFNNRYEKYIPGYKWTDDAAEWEVQPYIAEKDYSVSPIIFGGDVMVFGYIATTGQAYDNTYGYGKGNWPVDDVLQEKGVTFYHTDPDIPNQWDNEETIGETWCRHWTGANMFMFKILNDSVKKGLKPAMDPEDFQLMESWGGNGNPWAPAGVDIGMITTSIRKPEFYLPKAGFEESWGSTPDSSEWLTYNDGYFSNQGYGWAWNILAVNDDLGTHFMKDVTIYRSTVSSNAYIVSEGFTMDEEILGVVEGTTVTQFEANLIKADTGQTLTVISAGDGGILTADDVVADGDTLMVVSQDQTNTTKYVMDVTAEGLSGDAMLTSTVYDITADGATGAVAGMDYGVTLREVVDNLSLPTGANMTIINGEGTWVPFKQLNYDTAYVDVLVSNDIYFEVLAQDGATMITFQLTPNADPSDAFLTSDVYMVDQDNSFIDYIPMGTTVPAFRTNLTASPGATFIIVDKFGMERTFGTLYRDDKVVVTAEDGTEKVYYLSMLPEDEENVIHYLAYVLSDVYNIDQVELTIAGGLNTATGVTDFVGNLIPADLATVMVVDASDAENTTGSLRIGDLLKVTAGDGVTTAYYSLNVYAVSVDDLNDGSILVYPNPTNGIITVSGIETGNRIRVYNMLGTAIRDVVANQDTEVISLENEANGIYFVVVGNENETIGRYKLILE